jgi:hypothetical protein
MQHTQRDDFDSGRRDEDRRWLKIQEDVMNIVTTQRTNQQALATLEIEIGKLTEHVEEVDDHLRGVAGKESMDTRLTVLEHETHKDSVLLHHVVKKFDQMERMISVQLGEIKADLAHLKMQKAMQQEVEKSRTDRVMAWLGFWGPIIIATLALIVPLVETVASHWDKITGKSAPSYSDQWVSAIRKQREDPKEKKRLHEKYGKDVD